MSRNSNSARATAGKIGLTTVLGAGIGMAVGAAIGNVSAGVAVGAVLGVVGGVVLEFMQRNKRTRQ